jgi:hypothetical protein
VAAGERGAVGAFGRQPDVDVRGGQDAGLALGGFGMQPAVVAGSVCLLVVRRRDRA